jgi:hypothetical protein
VIGMTILLNGLSDKWKLKLVGDRDLPNHGVGNGITFPVVDLSSIRLTLCVATKHNLEIAVLDILTAFLECPLYETQFMRVSEGHWRDLHCRSPPLVKLNNTQYYTKLLSRWVEVKAILPSGKLELLTLQLHPPTRIWEFMNPSASS